MKKTTVPRRQRLLNENLNTKPAWLNSELLDSVPESDSDTGHFASLHTQVELLPRQSVFSNQTVKREQSRIGSFPQGESAPMIPGTEEHTSNEKENTRGT